MGKIKTDKKKILIVEDDEDMHVIYRNYFSDYQDKYDVEYEKKAESGLKKVTASDYDLIILDVIMMPMTGDSLFIHIRNEEKTADTPVLIVSVLSPDSLEALKNINHCEILQKPITQEQFINKIKTMV